MSKVSIRGTEVTVFTVNKEDYISLTDIAKYRNAETPADIVKNWLRSRSTIELLGLWEKLHNSDFKLVEFDQFKYEAGANSFVLSPKKWIESTNAIGLLSKSGRYGGTFAHKDIAFEFASWVSVEFKLYLIKEFQRLKEKEQEQLGWDIRRNLTKINYRIHTDAIKANLIPPELNAKQVNLVYASEADVLNMALFGMTARQWRDANSGEKGNVRDFANAAQLERLRKQANDIDLRNLSELAATKTVIESFKKAINELTVRTKGDAEIRDTINLRQTRPFVVKDQGYLMAKKSIFNRVIGDSPFELRFASFLEDCSDVAAYAKNYLAVHFKLDYVKANGDISNYYPDFLVKLADGRIVVVETKGQVDEDVPLKMARLRQWCEDLNSLQSAVKYAFAYVDDESFQKYAPKNFRQVLEGFRTYQ
jgi:hypothetical protein